MPGGETSYRRPRFVEGNWLSLAGGVRWCLLLPKDVPGHGAVANRTSRLAGATIFGLMNPEGVMRLAGAAVAGDPSGLFATFDRTLTIYRGAFLAGSNLLMWNYDLAPDQCDELMPFNFNANQLGDPASRLNRCTQAELAVANAVAAVCGIDFGPEVARVAASN